MLDTKTAEILDAFIDGMTAAIVICDNSLKVVYVNETCRKLLKGPTKDHFVGWSLQQLSPNISEERLSAYRQVLRTGEPVHIVDEIDHPVAGKRLWEIRAFKVLDGLAFVTEDVTDKDVYHHAAELTVQLRKATKELAELKASG